MPVPLKESEVTLAMSLADKINQREREEKNETKIRAEEKRMSYKERINRFIDNLITPRGT